MNTRSVCRKTFYVELDAIIELCSGFDGYFEKYPEQEKDFPCCNDPDGKKIKNREMFVGKKTETFSKLLNVMSITLDSAFLEAEYYLTSAGKGRVYEYKSENCSIAFDFRIDPTAQIECCGISLSFPDSLSEQIIPLITSLQNASKYVVNRVADGDFDTFNARVKCETGAHFEKTPSSNDWKEFKNRLQNEKITQPKSRVLLEKIFSYIKIALVAISVIVAIIKILQYCM